MEETYLIEIRLTRTKWRVKNMVSAIAGMFELGDFMERHPHVTLFGPLVLKETGRQELLTVLEDIAKTCDPVLFTIDGWEKRAGMNGSVLAFSVRPSPELKTLTRSISDKLGTLVTSLNTWDALPDKKWFHVTIANRLTEERSDEVFLNLERISASGISEKASGIFPATRMNLARARGIPENPVIWPLLIDEAGLRITLLQGEEILGEYDLLEKRWVMGEKIHAAECNRKTLADFRRYSGFELLSTTPPGGDDVFLIGDFHFGHANIIRYCSRPFLFPDIKEMDEVLIRNWNATVSPGNRAYFLGDLRYGNDAPPASYYREQLGGEITYIKGNHDDQVSGMIRSTELSCDGLKFYLVHDPDDAPPGFEDWVIHGHHHNNNLAEFPFINFYDRRINVSAEVVGYVPVSLREICLRIHQAEKTGNNQPVLLRYPHIAGVSRPVP